VRVWTRTGHELTERLPELAPLVDCCGGATVVLDGELIAGQGPRGRLLRVAAARRGTVKALSNDDAGTLLAAG